MGEPKLLSIGRAVPDRRYTQAELYEHSPWGKSPLLDQLFNGTSVANRGLFVPPEFYRSARTLSETNALWKQGALALGGASMREALQGAGKRPDAIGMFGVTTVTGYTTPGLDVEIARAEGLNATIQRAHFNCIGCHAAIPLLRTVVDYVSAHPEQIGAACAVEVCSACFVADDNPQNLVALSLFADGAATAIVGVEGDGPAIIGFETYFDFDAVDTLGFGLSAEGFRIVLDPSIPDRIADGIASTVKTLLERHDVAHDDVVLWCIHPGGARVLDAAQRSLNLDDTQMVHSRRVLRAFGNMSSPSVLFVLADALQAAPPSPGAAIVMLAFGPGLGIEAALLRA